MNNKKVFFYLVSAAAASYLIGEMRMHMKWQNATGFGTMDEARDKLRTYRLQLRDDKN